MTVPMTAQEIVEALCEAVDSAEYAQTKCYLMPDDAVVKKELEAAIAHRDRIKAKLEAVLDYYMGYDGANMACDCETCARWRELEEACRGKA